MSFKVGDLVRHKSGGPKLVVDNIDRTVVYVSFWNAKENKFSQAEFMAAALVPTTPGKSDAGDSEDDSPTVV